VDLSLPERRTRSFGLQRGWIGAAMLLCAAPLAHAQSAPPAPAAVAPAGWKQLYEDGQTIYYVDAAAQRRAGGASAVTSLLEYKVPQVIGGAQVWSIVTHMQVNCDEHRMLSSDNTLYASKLGGGPVVEAQPSNDSWHTPQPGTFGGLVWTAVCAKP
jgi:hypothetical protein